MPDDDEVFVPSEEVLEASRYLIMLSDLHGSLELQRYDYIRRFKALNIAEQDYLAFLPEGNDDYVIIDKKVLVKWLRELNIEEVNYLRFFADVFIPPDDPVWKASLEKFFENT
jgi:hypothetical protein